ncbi:MAG: hypothetical protein Q9M36_05320 [Sulfurovum sp.]|nr:hypothetical protein [Sulfurovum sp.]
MAIIILIQILDGKKDIQGAIIHRFYNCIGIYISFSKTDDFIVNLLPRTKEADDRYKLDKDERGSWKGASFLNPATPKKKDLIYVIQLLIQILILKLIQQPMHGDAQKRRICKIINRE